MPLIDHLFSVGPIRKAIWAFWYPFLTRRVQAEGVVFLNYAFETAPPMGIPLAAEERFDAVINVEASHCYPDFPGFLQEVARVLKPGGYFLYADFRFAEDIAKWESELEKAPMKLKQVRDISREVLRGMDVNSERSLDLLLQKLPGFMHGLGRDFAGVKGSRVYNALESGGLSYRSYCFWKPF